MTQLLRDLIYEVSDALDDIETGTLTGATDSMHPADTTRVEPTGHWTGGWLTVNGQEVRITAFSAGVFTTNALTTTPNQGDAYELRRHPRHRRSSIIRQINTALRDVVGNVWVRLDSRVDLLDTTIVDVTTPTREYAVPADLKYVHTVLYQPAGVDPVDTTWYPLALRDWAANNPGTISITDEALSLIPDKSPLKMLGSRPPRELLTDGSRVEIPGNYLLFYTVAQMALRMAKGQDADLYLKKAQIYGQLADAARKATRLKIPAGSRKVRV